MRYGPREIYRQEKQYYWQEREVFNHIAPIIEARLARLSRVRPYDGAAGKRGRQRPTECAAVYEFAAFGVLQAGHAGEAEAGDTVEQAVRKRVLQGDMGCGGGVRRGALR